MAYTSDHLALLMQETNDNPNSWGQALTENTVLLLEKGFVSTDVSVQAGNATLDDTQQTDQEGHYRHGILNITGSLSAARDVILPVDIKNGAFIKKAWIVLNSTTGGQTITFRTATGTGVTIPEGEAVLCMCDGTNIIGTFVETANLANTATTATSADDAVALGGTAAADYAQKAVRNQWTAGQVVERTALANTSVTPIIQPNLSVSNAFYVLFDAVGQISTPQNAVNGDQFSIVCQQNATGTYTVSFSSDYIFEGGSAPILSTGANAITYLAFEYVTGLGGGLGNKWIGSVLSNIS